MYASLLQPPQSFLWGLPVFQVDFTQGPLRQVARYGGSVQFLIAAGEVLQCHAVSRMILLQPQGERGSGFQSGWDLFLAA